MTPRVNPLFTITSGISITRFIVSCTGNSDRLAGARRGEAVRGTATRNPYFREPLYESRYVKTAEREALGTRSGEARNYIIEIPRLQSYDRALAEQPASSLIVIES